MKKDKPFTLLNITLSFPFPFSFGPRTVTTHNSSASFPLVVSMEMRVADKVTGGVILELDATGELAV